MKPGILQKFSEAVFWPEMKLLWFLLPALLAVFILIYNFLSAVFLGIVGFILLGLAIFVSAALYKAALILRTENTEKNELKALLFGLEEAILVYDRNFTVIFFSPSAEKLFGIDAKNILGRQIKPQDIERGESKVVVQVVYPSLAPSVVSRSKPEDRLQVADISLADPHLELRVTTSPIVDEGGGSIGFMKIIRDRTREIDLVKSKTEFLTVASHQLRTPLTESRWALESLQGENLSDAGKLALDGALKANAQLLKIVEDLLHISRIEEGRFGYKFEETDLVEFIGKSLVDIASMARRAGVRVYFDRPSAPPPKVLVDSEKFPLVLNNILENAVRYNIENGQVVVKVEEITNEPYLRVSISDTGIGIPQEDLDKLFGKFFRAENALKLQTEGSGLGLYIAKNVIGAHGGKIWAESEIGRGTTFYFTLPTDPKLVPQHEAMAE